KHGAIITPSQATELLYKTLDLIIECIDEAGWDEWLPALALLVDEFGAHVEHPFMHDWEVTCPMMIEDEEYHTLMSIEKRAGVKLTVKDVMSGYRFTDRWKMVFETLIELGFVARKEVEEALAIKEGTKRENGA
ncbi:hypothetical protein HDV00_011211, partial [Rhizophlyctis rosea]